MSGLLGDFMGGPGTGALGGPPTGHNYKRAVYRPCPKHFTVEPLPPTKFGIGFCYGMRVTPLQPEEPDTKSTRSGAFTQEYEVWRRWEDCLWFQEILEGEYALMARQKRARLAAGKGVKKNGIYVHSDQAASFESLPPGPDANSIAKDIHEVIPRLTKKGTLFRASQATIEQRGREFEALLAALFQEDVPMLIKELRESRLVRDFFGYWRRDIDHDRKRQSLGGPKDSTNSRHSMANSTFSMYFSASNISLQLPNNAFADLPPSPALPNSQGPSSPTSHDLSRRDSTHRDDSRRRSAGRAPVSYATSDSSASTASIASTSQSPPQDMTFFVSERGSLALNIVDDDDDRAEYVNAPLSAPARVRPFPTEDEEIFVPEPVVSGKGKGRQDPISVPAPTGDFHPELQALPEDSVYVHATGGTPPLSEIEEVPRTPLRRPRNNSCPDRSNRQCLFIPADAPRSSHVNGAYSALTGDRLRVPPAHRPSSRDGEQELRTPTTNSSSSRTSSSVFTTFSNYTGDHSRRSSWRTSMMSETSVAQSFGTSFANGSCADFDRQSRRSFATSYANGSCADLDRDRGRDVLRSSASLSSISTSGRRTALGHRESMTTLSSFLSDLSLDQSTLGRLTPPPSGTLRRSLSAGSRRPTSILATLGGQEDWYGQQDELLDAYFYDPGMGASHPLTLLEEQEPPRTPKRDTLQQPFHKEVSSPDRFPKPFRDRPPGQFHLPWSLPSTPAPSTPSTAQTALPLPLPLPAPPLSPPAGTPSNETLTLKAVLHDSIVLLRVYRSSPLAEVRTRLRDKFAAQEGVQLSSAFAIGWAPGAAPGAAGLRGRPRSNSASSVGAMNPKALRYVYSEQEWRAAVAACAGGKMTIRLFNAQPL